VCDLALVHRARLSSTQSQSSSEASTRRRRRVLGMSFLDRMCELEICGMIAAISREALMAHLKLFIFGQPHEVASRRCFQPG